MVLVRRANVELDIDNEDIDYYLSLGYSLMDASGNVLKKGKPMDSNQLQADYLEALEKIKELEEKIASLSAKKSKKQ